MENLSRAATALDPELAEQDAPLRVVLVVADALGEEVDVAPIVGGRSGACARSSFSISCHSSVAAGWFVAWSAVARVIFASIEGSQNVDKFELVSGDRGL